MTGRITSRPRLQRQIGNAALPVACILIVLYFAYYGLYGQHGLLSLVRATHEIELRRVELAELSTERARLERRVLNMRAERLDPDLLDELTRETLGYSAPGEIMVLEGTR